MQTLNLLFLLTSLILFSCNQKSKNENKIKLVTENVNKKTLEQEKIKYDCDLTKMIVGDVKLKNDKTKILNEPVALTFLNLNKLLRKFDTGNHEYLPEKLRNPDRQEIYKTYDISGSYYANIQPRLKAMSINIIDNIHTKGLLSFRVIDKKYTIDLGQFKETDGVLLYNGKDKPIFWPNEACHNSDILDCYYKNKNCP